MQTNSPSAAFPFFSKKKGAVALRISTKSLFLYPIPLLYESTVPTYEYLSLLLHIPFPL